MSALLAIPFLSGLLSLTACFPTEPAVRGVSAAEWKAELSSRRGSVTAVYVWATWCRDCVEAFPEFIELQPRYRRRGVEFLTLSVDDVGPEKYVAPVESFLRFQATGMPNFILVEPFSESMEMLEIENLPAVIVYRPDGEAAYRLEGGEDDPFDRGDIEAALQSLLPGPLPEVK